MQIYKKDQSEGNHPKQKIVFAMWHRFCTPERGQCSSRVCSILCPPLSRAMAAKALVLVVFVLLITIVGIILPLMVLLNGTKVYVDHRLVRAIAQGFIYAHAIDCSKQPGDVLIQT